MLRAVILSSVENREAEKQICRKRRKKKSREAGKAEKQGKQNAGKQRSRKAEKQEKQRSNVAEKQKSREAEKQKIKETGKHRTRNPKKTKPQKNMKKYPKINSPPIPNLSCTSYSTRDECRSTYPNNANLNTARQQQERAHEGERRRGAIIRNKKRNECHHKLISDHSPKKADQQTRPIARMILHIWHRHCKTIST